MEPVPSTRTNTYPKRGPLQQFRFAEATAFKCFRCGRTKKAKLITTYNANWSRKLCNGCYGRLLSLYEIKAGDGGDDERAERLARDLLRLTTVEEKRQAESLYRASEGRARVLSSEALRFIATAEHVAANLENNAQLEWSPAVIGLCKAVEVEIVSRILRPLADVARNKDLSADTKDKDIGRVAAFCAGSHGTSPELGSFSHFLQTVIHSRRRRQTSRLIGCFMALATTWADSTWILEPDGLHHALALLTSNYRNRAAHIDELAQNDYVGCREVTIGRWGVIWKLNTSTQQHK